VNRATMPDDELTLKLLADGMTHYEEQRRHTAAWREHQSLIEEAFEAAGETSWASPIGGYFTRTSKTVFDEDAFEAESAPVRERLAELAAEHKQARDEALGELLAQLQAAEEALSQAQAPALLEISALESRLNEMREAHSVKLPVGPVRAFPGPGGRS